MTTGIITAGFLNYRLYIKQHRIEVERQLSAIADLKIKDLVEWKSERISNGNILSGNPAFNNLVKRYFSNPADENAKMQIQTWLGKIKTSYLYRQVYLLDSSGKLILSIPRQSENKNEDPAKYLNEARRAGGVILTELHRVSPDKPIHLSVVAPITDGYNPKAITGFVVLVIDPEVYLYPMLKRWPVPSKSAETLLVRRDGNDVLFLNELRFKENTALNLRVSLANTKLPSVMAALGYEGLVEGLDYRGVNVSAALRSVSGTPWHMVARVDIEELYGPVKERFWLMVFVILGFIGAAGTGVGLIWQKRSESFYREKYEAAEELERSNLELQQFAYVASHDLQEPLRMISSYLQLIERRYKDKLDGDANDFINFAVEGANRLQSLILGLLEYSRVNSTGKSFAKINLRDTLEAVLKDLELKIQETKTVIEIGEMPVITGDEIQILRLFQNLIQNGIKFGREGVRPEIKISCEKTKTEYIFCVSDNGIGIEKEYFEIIFIIFQRLHSRDKYSGTGIGLSICQKIVERHGGKIWIESKFGEGSSFYFTIPVRSDG
jgi:signal transduction histidine kinase